jgi:hypothetical protein
MHVYGRVINVFLKFELCKKVKNRQFLDFNTITSFFLELVFSSESQL